jgi:hypothetical protein
MWRKEDGDLKTITLKRQLSVSVLPDGLEPSGPRRSGDPALTHRPGPAGGC